MPDSDPLSARDARHLGNVTSIHTMCFPKFVNPREVTHSRMGQLLFQQLGLITVQVLTLTNNSEQNTLKKVKNFNLLFKSTELC